MNSDIKKATFNTRDIAIPLVLANFNGSRPILLVCGGGPGIPEYFLEALYPSLLSEHFRLCYFDYRGTGRVCDCNVNPETVTTPVLLNDVIELTEHLIKTYCCHKIFILGHSFGTYIALKVVLKRPDLYYAYLAMSQICNQFESENEAYRYMISEYERLGKKSISKKLKKYNIKKSFSEYNQYFRSSLRDKAMHQLGIGTMRTMRSAISGLFFPSFKIKGFSFVEKIRIWRGKFRADKFPVISEVATFNIFKKQVSLSIPIYLFVGKYDYTTSVSLQLKFFKELDAPKKKLFMFEESAHSPIFEEPQKTNSIFKDIILESINYEQRSIIPSASGFRRT